MDLNYSEITNRSALIFNGYSNYDSECESISSLLIEELNKNDFEIEHVKLKDIFVAPCQGCFDCWVKTPGECRIDDYGREFIEKISHSNLIIHFTPITFGGYSSELKKVIDRFIPILLPFLTRRSGETHHKYRYENRASIIAIGVLDKPDKEKESIFKELVYRNSLNMGAPIHESMIYIEDQNKTEFAMKFNKILKKVEEKI